MPIASAQNEPNQLERLAAQRQRYSTAKLIFGWQAILSGPVAIASALLGIFYPDSKVYVACWGILVACADAFWLTPWQKRLKDSAARIQELFDCDVLELKWNAVKVGRRPEPELIGEQAAKYETRASRMPTLSNWYPQSIDVLPVHLGRLVCQRTNCWWDAKQRRRYATILVGSTIGVIIVVFLLSLPGSMTLENFLLKVVAPLAPAAVFALRQFSEQREAATRLDTLKQHVESAWENGLAGAPVDTMTQLSRDLQDEIFENRRKSPLVIDALFKRLRISYERQMNRGAEEYVAQAKHAARMK